MRPSKRQGCSEKGAPPHAFPELEGPTKQNHQLREAGPAALEENKEKTTLDEIKEEEEPIRPLWSLANSLRHKRNPVSSGI